VSGDIQEIKTLTDIFQPPTEAVQYMTKRHKRQKPLTTTNLHYSNVCLRCTIWVRKPTQQCT